MRIAEPGVEYDELLFVNAALGNMDGSFVEYSVRILGHVVPLMCMSYIGAVKSMLYAPIFGVFGTNVVTIRLPVILIGAIVIVLTYVTTNALFNRKIALITTALTAIDPTVIFQIKADWGPAAIMMLCKLGSLGCLLLFVRTRRLLLLASGALALGIGLYDKADFVWYIIALIGAALMVYRSTMRISLRESAVASGFFLLGCGPLLLYNLTRLGATVHGQFSSSMSLLATLEYKRGLFEQTLNGVAAFNYFNNFGALPSVLPFHLMDLDHTFGYGFTLAALLASAVLVALRARYWRQAAFVLLIVAILIAEITVTPQATGPHHVIFIYPFQTMLVSYVAIIGAAELVARFPQIRNLWAGAAVLAILMLALSNLLIDTKYLKSFNRAGGVGIWSDAIYGLNTFMEKQPSARFALMDWGFNEQLLALSANSIKRTELFPALSASDSSGTMNTLRRSMSLYDLFVFHSPDFAVFPRVRQSFDSAIRALGFREKVTKMYERDGKPVYEIVRLERVR